MAEYFEGRQGISYKVAALLQKTRTHETYLLINKKIGRHKIIHLLKVPGVEQIYDAPRIKYEDIQPMIAAPKKKDISKVLPWMSKGDYEITEEPE